VACEPAAGGNPINGRREFDADLLSNRVAEMMSDILPPKPLLAARRQRRQFGRDARELGLVQTEDVMDLLDGHDAAPKEPIHRFLRTVKRISSLPSRPVLGRLAGSK